MKGNHQQKTMKQEMERKHETVDLNLMNCD